MCTGRLLCDTYLSARELVKEVDYTLATLSRNLLSQERQELAAADVPGMNYTISPLHTCTQSSPSAFSPFHACSASCRDVAKQSKPLMIAFGGVLSHASRGVVTTLFLMPPVQCRPV